MSVQQARRINRRSAILDAAQSLFVTQGYEGTSLQHIVERSGGSLATLYKLFGSKEGILFAIVSEDPGNIVQIIERISRSPGTAAEKLMDIGQTLHAEMTRPEKLALLRVIVLESIRNPAFAQHLDQNIGEHMHNSMAILFRELQRDGAIQIKDDADEIAEMFLGMIVYDFQLRAITHRLGNNYDAALVTRRLERFCRLVGASDRP